jgi:hypothetical protein
MIRKVMAFAACQYQLSKDSTSSSRASNVGSSKRKRQYICLVQEYVSIRVSNYRYIYTYTKPV